MADFTREQLLATPRERAEIKCRGGSLWVWELGADQQPSVSGLADVPPADFPDALGALCVGDRKGPFSPPLTMAEFRGLALWLRGKIKKQALSLNRVTEEEVKELEGNSPSEP